MTAESTDPVSNPLPQEIHALEQSTCRSDADTSLLKALRELKAAIAVLSDSCDAAEERRADKNDSGGGSEMSTGDAARLREERRSVEEEEETPPRVARGYRSSPRPAQRYGNLPANRPRFVDDGGTWRDGQ